MPNVSVGVYECKRFNTNGSDKSNLINSRAAHDPTESLYCRMNYNALDLPGVPLRDADFMICGEAIDGTDAVSKAKELEPELIIWDVKVPELNGIEVRKS